MKHFNEMHIKREIYLEKNMLIFFTNMQLVASDAAYNDGDVTNTILSTYKQDSIFFFTIQVYALHLLLYIFRIHISLPSGFFLNLPFVRVLVYNYCLNLRHTYLDMFVAFLLLNLKSRLFCV